MTCHKEPLSGHPGHVRVGLVGERGRSQSTEAEGQGATGLPLVGAGALLDRQYLDGREEL